MTSWSVLWFCNWLVLFCNLLRLFRIVTLCNRRLWSDEYLNSPSISWNYKSGVHRYLIFSTSYNLTGFPLTECPVSICCILGPWRPVIQLNPAIPVCPLSHQTHGRWDGSIVCLLTPSSLCPSGCHHSLPSTVCNKRLPITTVILRFIYQRWYACVDDYNIICPWAAWYTRYFAFLRSGEFTRNSWVAYNLSMLSLGDVMLNSRSTPSMGQMTLWQSKTDMFGAGVIIYLGCTGTTLCPVSALLAYLAIPQLTSGPLFLLKSGDPLSWQALVIAVHLTLSSTGLDVPAKTFLAELLIRLWFSSNQPVQNWFLYQRFNYIALVFMRAKIWPGKPLLHIHCSQKWSRAITEEDVI